MACYIYIYIYIFELIFSPLKRLKRGEKERVLERERELLEKRESVEELEIWLGFVKIMQDQVFMKTLCKILPLKP